MKRAIKETYGEDGPEVVIGELPSRLIDKGLTGVGLLEHVMISKYEDHLSLYRKSKILRERHGVNISESSLGQWVEQVAHWLRSICEEMKKLKGDCLEVDEAPIRYLDTDVRWKSRQGFMWADSRPKGEVIFDWNISCVREVPAEILAGFK